MSFSSKNSASSSKKSVSSVRKKLHFVMIPLMAQGHLIPMVDMAKLMAKQGMIVTIVTTPVNADRIESNLYGAAYREFLNLRLWKVPFPDRRGFNISPGENLDMLLSTSEHLDFFHITSKLQGDLEQSLKFMDPEPSCIISDMMLPWTTELARKFNIPRIVFDGTSCFSLLCFHNLVSTRFLDRIPTSNTTFQIPNLPDPIFTIKAKQPSSLNPESGRLFAAREDMIRALEGSFGVVANSFKSLEPKYYERYQKAIEKKLWSVGPVSLVNRTKVDVENRGGQTRMNYNECVGWLNQQQPKTVVYAALGSLCDLDATQLRELAFGLECSRSPYILILREGPGPNTEELRKMLQWEGYEQRTMGRCRIIWGWVPQLLILQHPAIGGFLTHAGWNSALESLTFGIPMMTCPMFFDQFNNEEFLVRVLKVATKVRGPDRDPKDEVEIFRVRREEVRDAVNLVMDKNQSKEMRESAQNYSTLAQNAMSELGRVVL